MHIYEIDTKYIEYLRKQHPRVMVNEENGRTRKYIGIVLEINKFKYFVPLSSPKDNDFMIRKGKKVVRRSVVPIYRIITGPDINNFLGKLLFSNMIPVPDSVIKLLDLNAVKRRKYRTMMEDQIRFLRKHQDHIKRQHAELIYKQKCLNDPNIKYLNNTLDFVALESLARKYK